MSNNKICKFFMTGTCKKGKDCEFIHNDNLCKHFFKGICKFGDKCKLSHDFEVPKNNNKKPLKLIKKNTESFEPDHTPPDLIVKIADGSKEKFEGVHSERDVVLVTNMFNDSSIYEKLLQEISITGNEEEIWKLWHGDTHYIADDKRGGWKEKCPTFSMVIEKLKKYFDMDVKATRFNWYRDAKEWKPYHHDAAAVDPKKAKTQNLTVGVSFGSTRDISFQHAKTRSTVSIPQPDGMIYTFGKQVNIDWRHGIPQIKDPKDIDKGRISIILWGKNEQVV